jgi:hypothetical protein
MKPRSAVHHERRVLMTAWPQIKTLRSTLIAAGVVALFLCQRHLGFMVLLEGLILAPWIVFSIWVSIKNPQQRSLRAAKVGIWLLSVGIVIGVHFFVATQTRERAQKLVDAVMSYHASHGAYPVDTQSIGYTKEEVRSMIGMGGYRFEHSQPSFFYASTYVPFETEDYDFSKRKWKHSD